VAVAAWDAEGGVTMIEVATKQKLWSRRPGSNVISYLAFSPDSRVVYGGGTEGAVYAMDVKTGNRLSRWYASASGKEEYGHRISSLAVSPDGRWIAAGTGPEGLVFVGSTATNKCVKILKHLDGILGSVAVVQFSPNSQALATFVPGTLRVWNVTQWDKTAAARTATTSAPTQPAATQSESGT
jgi:WD40 repeat protein